MIENFPLAIKVYNDNNDLASDCHVSDLVLFLTVILN